MHFGVRIRYAPDSHRVRVWAECVSIRSVPGLDTPIMYVRGVGPQVAEMLAAKSILTAEDLLYHLPFRYEDRQNPRSLDELKPGRDGERDRGGARLRSCCARARCRSSS